MQRMRRSRLTKMMTGVAILLASGAGALATSSTATAAIAQSRTSSNAVDTSGPADIVGMTPGGAADGYWLVGADGGVFAENGASFQGSVPGLGLHVSNIVGIASVFSGYWVAGSDGGVFSFGNAPFDGSLPALGIHVSDIVGIATTGYASGGSGYTGYLLVGADGGVFAFGGALFEGSLPGDGVDVSDIVGIAPTFDGRGYWLVGADGGVFAFGDAQYEGSIPGSGIHSSRIVGIAPNNGGGYWLVGADGGVFSFGGATFYGSGVGQVAAGSIVAIIPSSDGAGYNITSQTGTNYRFGDGPAYSPATGAPMRGGGLVDLPGDCSDMQTLGYSWYYDWELNSSCPNMGVPFVPMQWGDWCSGSTCTALPASLAASGNPYLLTFNEPDSPSQSNMTVARALQLWPYLEATGLQLSSPAVTDTSRGSTWLADFMAGAKQDGYRVDFIAVHWYGNCSSPQSLVSYLAGLESYGLPLWLTEFSCLNGSAAVNSAFIQQVGPMLETLPYLQRIGWFSNRPYSGGYQNTGLLDASGTLSTVGQAYTALPAG
jgi:Glycosyl hydrolase catalytic core